jgi:hypothetical protein
VTQDDPIRHLQQVLEDPSHLLERISRIQSAIGSAKPAEASNPAEEVSESDKSPYDGLLRMVRDMQTQIDRHVRPLALRAMHAEADRLQKLAGRELVAQKECLAALDRTLSTCVDRIHEFRRVQGQLAELNRKLDDLGAPPEWTPGFDPAGTLTEILQDRIAKLRRQGKL